MSNKFTNISRTHQLDLLIVTNVSATIGLGHLSRMLAIAQSLINHNFNNFKFIILGETIKFSGLKGLDFNFIEEKLDFHCEILNIVNIDHPKIIIFDLHPRFINNNLEILLGKLSNLKIHLIGVDSLYIYADKLNITWIPSFYKRHSFFTKSPSSIKFGWDSYLIQKRLSSSKWSSGNRVLILTGGSDFSSLGKTLPKKIDNLLPKESEIHWVQGPFAPKPNLSETSHLRWFVHDNLESLDELIVKCNYALTVFGVSLFELLQYGIPTVVFSPYDGKDNDELVALKKENVAIVSENVDNAINDLVYLMENDDLSNSLSLNAMAKLSVNGAKNLAYLIIGFLEK